MPIGRYFHEWPFTYDSIVLSHLMWENDLLSKDAKLPTLKAQIKILVISLPRAVTVFEAAPAGHFSTHVTKYNRIVDESSLMQVPANRHMTDFTENDILNYFYGFFVDFQRFVKNSWKPDYWTVEGLEKKCKKEIRMKKLRRKMVSFKMAWSGFG